MLMRQINAQADLCLSSIVSISMNREDSNDSECHRNTDNKMSPWGYHVTHYGLYGYNLSLRRCYCNVADSSHGTGSIIDRRDQWSLLLIVRCL